MVDIARPSQARKKKIRRALYIARPVAILYPMEGSPDASPVAGGGAYL